MKTIKLNLFKVNLDNVAKSSINLLSFVPNIECSEHQNLNFEKSDDPFIRFISVMYAGSILMSILDLDTQHLVLFTR